MALFSRLSILVLVLAVSPAWAHPIWTNEPSGMTALLDCPFSGAPSSCGILDVYNSANQDTDGTAPVSPSGVVRSTIGAGQSSGGMQLNWLTPGAAAYREMFTGIMWRTNPEFQGRSGGNKLFFMRGPDSIGVFVIQGGLSTGSGPLVWVHNSSSLNNSHVCSADLGLLCYPNASSGLVQRGVWTKIEAYIKASTTNTSRDGIVRWWINGVLAGNYTNINYAGAGLNEWIWTETWDGFVNPTPSVAWSHYIDHVYASFKCAGSCAPASSDTTPPSQVTGVISTAVGSTTAGFSWAPATDNIAVLGYQFEYCAGAGCTDFSNMVNVSGTSISLSGLSLGTTYLVRVKAYDAAGNVSGSYSDTVSITTSGTSLPAISSLTVDTTGADLVWTGDPTSIRVATDTINVVEPIALFPFSPDPIAFVQGKSISGSGSSVSLAFDSANAANCFLLMRYAGDPSATISSVSDTRGNVWSKINDASNNDQSFWYAQNCAAGANTVTPVMSGVSGFYELNILEYSGVHLTSPVHHAAIGAKQIAVGTSADAVVSPSRTTLYSGEMAIGATVRVGGPGLSTTAGGTGWTIRGDAFLDGPIQEKLIVSPSSVTSTWTAADASNDYYSSLITLRPAGEARYSRQWSVGTTFACFYPRDISGNENSVSPGYQCRSVTPAGSDSTPPTRANGLPSTTLAQGTTSAVISLSTDEPATCKFDTSAGTAYDSMPSTMDAIASSLFHYKEVTGLSDGGSYNYYVRCRDLSGNANSTDTTISFAVAAAPGDSTAPSQVTGLSATAVSSTQIAISYPAATDNVAVTAYEVYVSFIGADYAFASVTSGTSLTISELSPATLHLVKVRARDAAGNVGAFSDAVIVETPPSDTDRPSDVTGLAVRQIDYHTLEVSWDEGTDNVGVYATSIEQCEGSACTSFKLIATVLASTGRTLRISLLAPTTTYRFRAKHADAVGNVSENYPAAVSGTTAAVPVGTVTAICPCKHRR